MENLQPIEREESLELKEKAVIQIAIIRSMIRRGVIKTAMEYVDNGYADAFELLFSGAMRCATDKEMAAIRTEAEKLTKKI